MKRVVHVPYGDPAPALAVAAGFGSSSLDEPYDADHHGTRRIPTEHARMIIDGQTMMLILPADELATSCPPYRMTAFTHLGEPVWMPHDWPHFIYLFIADSTALVAAALILAWFLPRPAAAPADAPSDV